MVSAILPFATVCVPPRQATTGPNRCRACNGKCRLPFYWEGKFHSMGCCGWCCGEGTMTADEVKNWREFRAEVSRG